MTFMRRDELSVCSCITSYLFGNVCVCAQFLLKYLEKTLLINSYQYFFIDLPCQQWWKFLLCKCIPHHLTFNLTPGLSLALMEGQVFLDATFVSYYCTHPFKMKRQRNHTFFHPPLKSSCSAAVSKTHWEFFCNYWNTQTPIVLGHWDF